MTDEQIIIPGITGDDNSIRTRYHSLFIKDLEPVTGQIVMPEGLGLEEQLGSNIINAILEPAHKLYTLYLSEFHNDDGELHEILNRLRQGTEDDELEIHIGSRGGYVYEGIALFGIMKENFGGRVETYIDSNAMSMGAMAFCYGDRRLAYEYSHIMFHDWQGGTFGSGGNVKVQSDFYFNEFRRMDHEILVGKGFFTEREYERMTDGREYYFGALEMAKRGIATDIVVEGYTLPAEDYIEYRESGFTFNEYKEYKELEAQEA